jgi:phytanoyl-CoA hydroxylase
MGESATPFFSRFGGLWTDRVDAASELERRRMRGDVSDTEAAALANWMANGYVILEKAVPPDDCDALAAEIASAWAEGAPDLLTQPPGEHETGPPTPDTPPHQMRIVDVYAARRVALKVLLAPAIVRFLTLIFDAEPLLFQGLTFECGSEQGIHQDSAYVVVSSPMELVASWTALEDIQSNSGELQYYEGSHRLPEYLFSGEHKSWDGGRDGIEQHDEWAQLLHVNSERLNFPLRTFRPKKGDTLIWSADLAHGGAAVTDRSQTRRSQVGHYCPEVISPNYFRYRPDRRHKVRVPGGWISSEYYDLGA